MSEPSVLEFGHDLLDHGVAPVVAVGVDGAPGGVGDESVVPMRVEQGVLGVLGALAQAFDAAHREPALHVLVGAAGDERGVRGFGDFRVGTSGTCTYSSQITTTSAWFERSCLQCLIVNQPRECSLVLH